MKYIIVSYNQYGYTIYLFSGGQIEREIYSAGNNKYSSATTDSVPLDNHCCLPLWRIRQFAKQTGKEVAKEEGVKYIGVEYDKFNIEGML